MKRNTKEVRGSTSDIISNLPESIKATVLVCLPIQDAVRTSVLSTKWRYIWTKLPQLVFDDNFCRESAGKSKTELMMTIYQVLLLHRGPIPKFILNLSRMESCPEMDQLILFLSNNGIQEFTLLIEKGEPYKLLSSLFSCEQLRYLSLRSCVFKSPSEFKGFSRLVELVLYRVFVASDTLSSLISSCPLLEKLSLKRTFSSDCLEINAPNLRFLVCEIYGSSICLKNTARLARVSICFMGIFNVEGITQAETSKLVTLFGSLPVIEFLLLEYHTIRYMSAGGVPKRLPTTLNNLKTLKLLSICFEEVNEISVILCLIRSSPNLEKITIVVRRCETADVIDHVLQLLEMQDWSDVSLNQLQVVELGNLSGTQSELKFIELLLAILSVLETMFIQTDSEKVADKGLRILTEDVVRTNVLSKKWRYIWTKLPQLVFDDNFCRESTRKTKTELMMTIYQVLLLHRGPIPKFILNLSRLESCPEINQLILFLSNNGIEEFALLIRKGDPYKLPSSLFSCEQLRCLRFRSCVFKSPPEVKGFSRLLELVLYEVVVTAHILSSLISSCPLLEKLSLKSSGSLDSLEINAPNLRFLCCEIHARSICLKNTARLERVFICLKDFMNVDVITQAETSKLVTLFGSLPVIEFLQLEYDTVRYMSAGGVPKRLPTSLNNLKTLKLFFVCFEEVNEISVILCLIRSSPNLEKITIVASSTETADVIDPVLELLEMKDWSGVSVNQLQVVQLGGLYGTQSELKFIKLLLAISPVLETMFIQTDAEKVANEGLRILKEVTRFPRLSPQAEI